MNFLKAVFWDYPELTNPEKLKEILKNKRDQGLYTWILGRFMEYGRVVDTLEFFRIEEIEKAMDNLPLRFSTKKKWKRIMEVYGQSRRE